MENLRGANALLTGGSGGIGTHIARALAREGMNVIVAGRRQDALDSVVGELQRIGVSATALTADLEQLEEAESLADRAERVYGSLDVVVHNAGIEIASSFTRYTREELTGMLNVNLAAPLLMTHRVLPGMLARGAGHIVFMSSLAGKVGPAYEEPYAATKAGLIGLTQSLRAEYADSPVGFSVICPGFVGGDGMYQRMVEQGFTSNRLMGATTTDRIAADVVRAIRRDVPEVVDTGSPVRPLLALAQVAPRTAERAMRISGAADLFRRLAVSRGRAE
jgi:short-subunit dehydrogenase